MSPGREETLCLCAHVIPSPLGAEGHFKVPQVPKVPRSEIEHPTSLTTLLSFATIKLSAYGKVSIL